MALSAHNSTPSGGRSVLLDSVSPQMASGWQTDTLELLYACYKRRLIP